MEKVHLASLPEEILLHILSFLEPLDIIRLQQVSSKFCDVGRDGTLWRSRCLEESPFLEAFKRRQSTFLRADIGREHLRQVALQVNNASTFSEAATSGRPSLAVARQEETPGKKEMARIMANWDPSYPIENVSWYHEYIQRHGEIAVNWFQQPHIRQGSVPAIIEARGVAFYRPDNPGEVKGRRETLLAVSPLDDGSVCLWDVNGSKGKRGVICAKSPPGILFIDGPGADNRRRSKRVDSGVTECVSVDSYRNRAFFAVQSHLIEVDLQRLSVVGCESFPWSITTLSTTCPTLPLTVGTSLGIHLYDYRARASGLQAVDGTDGIDGFDRLGATNYYERSVKALFNDEPLPPCASLSQPGPLSILHLQRPGGALEDISDDIYVAGRFSNILHYDRRKFPSIRGSIHSGARLCSMTSLPYPFSTLDSELRRKGQLSLEQVERSKASTGRRTIAACGEYNTKGSLELYGLNPPSEASPQVAGGLQSSTLKNRQTSSQSKLLSVVNHGTRLAFSNGSGLLKWFERDGFTEVRRCRIGHCEGSQAPSLFSSMPGSDDIARKLLPTQPGSGDGDGASVAMVNNDDLLFWTGEKLGLVTFSAKPGFTAEDFEAEAKTAEELAKEKAEREYSDRVRLALHRQAEDARFVQGLGLGVGLSQ